MLADMAVDVRLTSGQFLTAKQRRSPLCRNYHKTGSTRTMPLAIVDRPAVSLETAKSLKNSKPSASNAPRPSSEAEEEKYEPPVCPQNDERRSPEKQRQKGGTSRREQSDRVDRARRRQTWRESCTNQPINGTFAPTRLFAWRNT
jgi:hypothetical protein